MNPEQSRPVPDPSREGQPSYESLGPEELLQVIYRQQAELQREQALRRAAEERAKAAENESFYDARTGLMNVRGFQKIAAALRPESPKEGEHERRDRHAGTNNQVVVLSVDIDRFKDVNTKYGHAGGNEVLKEVAAYLQSLCRKGDVVARLGGEEFVVVFMNTDPAGLLERLSEMVEQRRLPMVREPSPQGARRPADTNPLQLYFDAEFVDAEGKLQKEFISFSGGVTVYDGAIDKALYSEDRDLIGKNTYDRADRLGEVAKQTGRNIILVDAAYWPELAKQQGVLPQEQRPE